MKLTLILWALVLLSTKAPAIKDPPSEQFDAHYIAGCKILDGNFRIIRILSNDWICFPLDDGGWIATNEISQMTKHDAAGDVLWKLDGYFHHRIIAADKKSIIVMKTIEKKDSGKNILYDEILKIDIETGKTLAQFSIFDEIRRNPEIFKPFDRPLIKLHRPLGNFTANWEKVHLNSIAPFNDEYIVNDIGLVSFTIDKDLKFKRFVQFPKKIIDEFSGVYHDLQMLGPDHYLLFENFFGGDAKVSKSFKVYEFKNGEIIFEFPQRKKDYVKSDFSGGVSKLHNYYLVSFPMVPRDFSKSKQKSLVGLVDLTGKWVKKEYLPFRFQEVKPLEVTHFLKLNRVK